jgi:hypothetical protein
VTDDRSERLRKRRKESRDRRRDPTRRADAGPGDRSRAGTDVDESDSDSSSAEQPSTSEAESGSVKEEQTGTYMYLPTSQAKKLRRVYNILKAEYEFEFDEEFEKNRHFYPLVVEYGLDNLEGMDASEIRDRLQTLGR